MDELERSVEFLSARQLELESKNADLRLKLRKSGGEACLLERLRMKTRCR